MRRRKQKRYRGPGMIAAKDAALMALGLAVLVLVLYMDDPTRDQRMDAGKEGADHIQTSDVRDMGKEAQPLSQSCGLAAPLTQGSLMSGEASPERSEPVPDADEGEQIEAALVEQGYFREDIPLSYEEQDLLHTACEEFGVPYELAVAVIWKETTYENKIGDSGKSFGYMQVKQDCHEDRMSELGVTDLMNPAENFRVGCHYLAELLAKYDGNVEMALMAYNAGPGGANKYWFSEGVYSNEYSRKVLNYMEGLINGEM